MSRWTPSLQSAMVANLRRIQTELFAAYVLADEAGDNAFADELTEMSTVITARRQALYRHREAKKAPDPIPGQQSLTEAESAPRAPKRKPRARKTPTPPVP